MVLAAWFTVYFLVLSVTKANIVVRLNVAVRLIVKVGLSFARENLVAFDF